METEFKLTERQDEGNDLLGSEGMYSMLFGGGRSGKTLLILRAIVTRAMAHKSRHAVLRYRFNHVKESVVLDTLPKMMDLCFPGVAEHSKLDKSDWFYTLPNGSEIWFGGLDDKDRTEKILGKEFASMFFNECSQIPFSSVTTALTRLAQNTPLRLRAYFDCNPPGRSHWTYKLFVSHINPERNTPVPDPENYVSMQMNPEHNRENLPEQYFKILDALPERKRQRFLLGVFAQENESALWTPELLDKGRIVDTPLPDMQRILIAVDPSGSSGPEDTRSDEVGIIVVGLGTDGKGYVLEDLSGNFGPGGNTGWGNIVVHSFDRLMADAVVAETNYGGAMVQAVIKAIRVGIPFHEVKASRGKWVRAEPIAALFEQGKLALGGRFPELEDQMCSMTTGGYIGSKSPDRCDAMVWGFTKLFSAVSRGDLARNQPIRVINHSRVTQAAGRDRRLL